MTAPHRRVADTEGEKEAGRSFHIAPVEQLAHLREVVVKHWYEGLVNQTANNYLGRVIAARRLATPASASKIHRSSWDHDLRTALCWNVRVAPRVIGEILGGSVGLKLDQPLIDVTEIAHLEVGVIDPTSVFGPSVKCEVVERLAKSSIRWTDSREHFPGRRLEIVVEEAAVVRGDAPFQVSVRNRRKRFLEVAPDVGRARIEIALRFDCRNDRVEALTKRVLPIADRGCDWEVLTRLGVENEEQPVKEDQRRVVDGFELRPRHRRIAEALKLVGNGTREAWNNLQVDAVAEPAAEGNRKVARAFADRFRRAVALQRPR